MPSRMIDPSAIASFAVSLPRLCVTSLSGGGGKTLLSLGLARALADMGLTVKPFKKGPDYIDAAWLALAAGRPATNLDPFFLPPARLRALFAHAMAGTGAGLGLLEGNRGLFDGLDVAGSCSTAELARVLSCPVLLSVDCTKMTRTAAALVQGLVNFEPGLVFGGVVLNQVGSVRHESLLRRALEEYTDLPVLGALPRLQSNPLPERHMGIASHGDGLAADAQAVLDRLALLAREHVDLEAVLAVARTALLLHVEGPFWPEAAGEAEAEEAVTLVEPAKSAQPIQAHGLSALSRSDRAAARPRIGYVRDAALWFYYEENLEALVRAGAELVRLSLLDSVTWPELDGLYLGGGFPEDVAPELSGSPHLSLLARRAGEGMPMYAECGGFMLLSRGIERQGRLWPMCGVFPVTARFCRKPQGLGYVRGTVVRENPYFPQGLELRGHEFHYSRCQWPKGAPASTADTAADSEAAWVPEHVLALERGQGMGNGCDALIRGRIWASYTHIFAPATPCWARNFVAVSRLFQRERTAAPEVSGHE